MGKDTSRSSSRDKEFESSDDCEELKEYREKGYHPVQLGENFANKYKIIQKLGWGHFSTVWLVQEKESENYFALKIIKSKQSYVEVAEDEISLLSALKNGEFSSIWKQIVNEHNSTYETFQITEQDTFVIKKIDNFNHFGLFGKHPCITFEIVGPCLLDVIRHYEDLDQLMPLKLVKQITRQTLMGLDYMHRVCGVIHTDIKPENIAIQIHESQLVGFVEQVKSMKRKPMSMKYLSLQSQNKSSKQAKKKAQKQKKKIQQQSKNDQPIQETTENTENFEENTKQIPEQELNHEQKQDNEDKKSKGSYETIKPELDTMQWKNHIPIKLDDDLKIKIIDFGNGCWQDKHFTENIQTPEYRGIETILGINYTENVDIWSLGCMIYELITNQYLFKPKDRQKYSKDDDHLAMMIETLGPIPKKLACGGKYSKDFFNKNGDLKNVKNLYLDKYTITYLLKKEGISSEEAAEIEEFLRPMLEYDPEKRVSAKECLQSKWLWN